MSARRSATPSYTVRMAPAVNAVLPPRSASGARSSTSTSAPASRAASAAHIAALPAPITRTSVCIIDSVYLIVWGRGRQHETLVAVGDDLVALAAVDADAADERHEHPRL